MKDGAARLGRTRQLCDRLDCPDLVVGVHDGDKCGLVGQRRFQGVRRHDATLIDGEKRRLPVTTGEGPQRIEDGLVLDRRRYQMLASRDFKRLGYPTNSEVVALGAAAREDDFRW